MSEINRLNHTGDAIAMPTMVPTHTSGQRFQQLIAQTPQEEADNNPWGKAAEQLKNTQYTDTTGTPQAYVNNGTLTAAGKSRLETAQDHLRHTTGASEVSIEQGAKQLLIEALTTQYANENNPALLQRAQQLQTELYSELTSTPSAAPQEVNPEPTLANLEPYLENQLQQLGLSRTEFEASTVDLGNGDVPVSALLATETSPRGQLQLLISIAAQQLRAQQVAAAQVAAAQVPAAEPLAPPVVEPVKVTEAMKLQPGELYEFERGEQTPEDVVRFVMGTFNARLGETYFGSTYHLQFLDENGEVMHFGPVLSAFSGPQSSSATFSNASNQMSIYWHGPRVTDGTIYSIDGDMLGLEPSDIIVFPVSAIELPIVMLETETGIQRLRIDQIPFEAIRVSNEGNHLFELPTQADVDEALVALETPQDLNLQQVLKYMSPALHRASEAVYAKAMSMINAEGNLQAIINNEFAGTTNAVEVVAKARELSEFVIKNRRGFDRAGTSTDIYLNDIATEKLRHLEALKLQTVTNELAVRTNQDFSDVGVNIHRDVDLRGVNLSNLNLSGQVLYRLDLRGANLQNVNLENAHLIHVKLSGANLENANLRGAAFEEVDLQQATMQEADLTGSYLNNVDLRWADLGQANLSNLDFKKTQLSDASLAEADLRGVRLPHLTLERTTLRGADLRGASFFDGRLLGVDLTAAQLSETNFENALVYDLTIDQTTLDSAPALKQIITPNLNIEEQYRAIGNAVFLGAVTSLRDGLYNPAVVQTSLDTHIFIDLILPRMAERQRELILSGARVNGAGLKGVDLAYLDLGEKSFANAVFSESDFAFSNMRGLDLRATTIGMSKLDGADLRQVNISGGFITYSSAIGAQLQSANLKNSTLSQVNLERADLSGANVSGANLELDLSKTRITNLIYDDQTTWAGVTLTLGQAQTLGLRLTTENAEEYVPAPNAPPDLRLRVQGSGASVQVTDERLPGLPKAIEWITRLTDPLPPRGFVQSTGAYDFSGLNIPGLNLPVAKFDKSDFQDANLHNVNFKESSLVQANFSRADLREVSLQSANLSHAEFSHANLTSAVLSNAEARGANFYQAQLVNANLSNVDLGGANLSAANLANTNLSNADLRATNLNGVDLRETNLSRVQHNAQTQWHGAQLSPEQIQTLGLEAEQLTPNNTISPGETNLGISQNNSSAPADPDTPNSLQGNSSAPPDISDYGVSHTLKPFNNPNGIIGNDGTQAGHGNNGNNNGAITAVAGDAPDPDQPFQVINGQINVSGIQLPELDLSGNVVQPGESIFGTPVGLPELPTYTPAPRTEEGAADIPVADSGSETTPPIAQQPGGVTWGGDLGNDKGRTAAELGLDPSGKLPGPEKAKMPEPTPGYGEGVNPQDLNQTNTRDWGGGPVTPDQAKLPPEGFPQQDKTLEGILNPEGPAGARFRFPPSTEEIPAAEYQAVVKALPALQQISVGEYSQLSAADQNNILSRAVEYQSLPADIKANTSLLQYADRGQTSASQRGQMLGVQQKQTVQTSQQILSDAQSGLSDSTIQVINTRINALQQNTAAINQQTQVLTQSNTNRQNALAAPTTSDPVTAAFIKPDIKPGQTPPASNSAPESQINTQADPIPRFMVVRTANGPQLMENLPNGNTQMLPYPIPADTPVTRQASNGSWTHVPDAYAIGAKNLLDTLFLQGAVKMLNNGNAVQSPSTQSAPQAPTGVPQPAF